MAPMPGEAYQDFLTETEDFVIGMCLNMRLIEKLFCLMWKGGQYPVACWRMFDVQDDQGDFRQGDYRLSSSLLKLVAFFCIPRFHPSRKNILCEHGHCDARSFAVKVARAHWSR